LKRKVASGIMLTVLLIGMLTLAFKIQLAKPEPMTIIVPDDYEKIQWAIGNASVGDTIFVRAGTYYEHVIVNKAVTLTGENRTTTIIDGNYDGVVVNIVASGTEVSEFTIQNGADGIYTSSGNNLIKGNIVKDNSEHGIHLYCDLGYNFLDSNVVMDNPEGIRMNEGDGGMTIYPNTLRNNIMANNSQNFAIWAWTLPRLIHDIDTSNTVDNKPIYYWINRHNEQVPTDAGFVAAINSTNIIVKDLILTNNHNGGVYFYSTRNSIITNVTFLNNNNGIMLIGRSDYNTITGNTFVNNKFAGIYYGDVIYNSIYHNNFVDNARQVFFSGGLSTNNWDNGYPSGGNYWSDSDGTDVNGDGIGDTPYVIDGNNQDNYPLIHPYGSVRNLNTSLVYLTMQLAINAPETLDGHTIFVEAGTYYGHVVVNKSVSLIGENKSTTIIESVEFFNRTVVYVTASNVVISGFTIQYGPHGIFISDSSNSAIIGNVIVSNYYGILSIRSDNNIIRENIFLDCVESIHLRSRNNTIIGNTLTSSGSFALFLYTGGNNSIINNTIALSPLDGIYILDSSGNFFRNNKIVNNRFSFGVYSAYYIGLSGYLQDIDISNTIDGKPIYYLINQENITVDPITFPNAGYLGIVNSTNVTVKDLNLTDNMQGLLFAFTTNSTIENVSVSNIGSYGVHLDHSVYNKIFNNELISNSIGIYLSFSNSNTVSGNLLKNNPNGVAFSMSSDNLIYHNNFINNTRGVYLCIVYPYYNDTSLSDTIWDNDYPSGGNYWSDYNGTDLYSGPYQNQTGPDAIGDTPYIINMNNTDNYPLINPWSPVTIQNTTITKGGIAYPIQVISNATILDFKETSGSLKLSVSGANGTSGYVRVIQPVGLNSTRIKVFVNNTQLVPPPYPSISTNGTHYFIYFGFTFASMYNISIEFPIAGDVNCDGIVNIVDIVLCALAFHSTPTDPNWNPHADLYEDEIINIIDIVIVAIHFWERW